MRSLAVLAMIFVMCDVKAAANSEIVKSLLEAQPWCSNFVRLDSQNLYLGSGWYKNGVEEPRRPIPGKFRVVPLNGDSAFELTTQDAAIDLIAHGQSIFVLTYSSIEEWNLNSRVRVAEYPTYAISGALAHKQHAQAMARYRDKLIIAHGRLGVSFFDLKSRRVTRQFPLLEWQRPLESMATGVAIRGSTAYVVMDNFHVTRPGDKVKVFRGLILIDMDSESVTAELGGMDPGADSVAADERKLLVSFGGMPIWKFNLDSLVGNGLADPESNLWRYPVNGHPIGAAALDDKYYYTCFSKAPSYPGENGGFYRKVPMALNRAELMLD